MLFPTKLVSLVAIGSLFATVQAASQHVLQNYETQGYRVLSNENVDGYTVRIKQPKSCEENIQVNSTLEFS